MPDPEPYNDKVRQYFANPMHAGDLPPGYTATCAAMATESADGARVELRLAHSAGRIAAMRFRAWGCPHLVAGAEAICEQFEGAGVESLARFDAGEYMRLLAVPVEKTGRILLLEDAVRLLHARVTATQDEN